MEYVRREKDDGNREYNFFSKDKLRRNGLSRLENRTMAVKLITIRTKFLIL